MFTINTYEYDCTKKCRSLEHGKTITYALTKRSVADSKLAAFIAKTCRNFTDVLDYEGRSSLHLAASVNRYTIAEWLINNGANINLKDEESLQTPLHRAIWYGNISIAVLLLKLGASLDIVDSDFKIPLQYTCNPQVYRKNGQLKKEMVLWGGNKNYNLGIGDEQERNAPQHIEEFRKNNIIIAQVSISVYHTIFLTDNGEIYVVGHGKGGRLGIGVEYTLVTPKKVQISFKHAGEKIISISAGRYHSLILTDSCNIYATGMNNHCQLGVKSAPESVLQFKEISNLMKLNGKNMRGVKAHDTYSLAYNSNEIFVWGTNNGQFGVKKEMNPITVLQELPINNIELFDSGNTAIACYTNNKYFYVFSKYKTKSFKTPKLEAIVQLLVIGNDATSNESNNHATQANVRILILTESQSVYMWHEDIQKYVKCIFPVAEFSIDRMVRCSKRVVFMSNGDIYMGNPIKFNYKKIELGAYQETYNKKDICDMTKVKFELKRIPYVSRALDVVIDEMGENFIVLQENPSNYLNIPKVDEYVPNFQMLLDEANEFDAVHDVIFHVDYQKFVAHKYIVSCSAPGLGEIIKQYPDKNIHLNFDRLTGNIFQAILNYIYTNQCLSVNEIFQLYPANSDKKDALNNFRQFLDRFQIKEYTIDASSYNKITQIFPKFDRKLYPEYHDVKIKCLNNQIIKAHKCILVGRLEYFNMMFGHTWSENDVVNLSNISSDYMELIINWLYTYDFNFIFKNQNYTENFIYQMIILCDQFFINDLKLHYEVLLLERLNIKNCGYMLELSNFYNCPQLEDKCLEYICCNIDRIIELGSLNNLEVGMLNKINRKYADLFKSVEQRVITPYSDTIDDEYVDAFVNNFKIHFSSTDGGNDNDNSNDNSFEHSKNGKTGKKNKNKLNRQTSDRTRESVKYEKNVLHDSSNRDDKKSSDTNTNKVELRTNTSPDILDKEKNKNLWTTVIDKKNDSTKSKKMLKANEILKNEKKDENKFVNLNLVLKNSSSSTSNIQNSNGILQQENDVTSPGRNIISLADFTPIKRDKLSQKQRKRLSSESSQLITVTPNKPVIVEKVVASSPPVSENVWKSSPPINIPSKSSTIMASSLPSPSSPILTNIYEIQKDEKKQKEYYHRMKTKSLMLTQIEEKAIEELQKFYNCDNVFDEMITIERKSRITMNCAIWQHY